MDLNFWGPDWCDVSGSSLGIDVKPALLDEATWTEDLRNSVDRLRRQLVFHIEADEANNRVPKYIVAPAGDTEGYLWVEVERRYIDVDAALGSMIRLGRRELNTLEDLGFDGVDLPDGQDLHMARARVKVNPRDPHAGWKLAAAIVVVALTEVYRTIDRRYSPPLRLRLVDPRNGQ